MQLIDDADQFNHVPSDFLPTGPEIINKGMYLFFCS